MESSWSFLSFMSEIKYSNDIKKKNLVLWVEDDESLLSLIRFAAKRLHNVDFILRSDGTAILEELNKYNPDIIVLDIILSDTNGFELCCAIREQNKFRNTPIIAYTSLEDDEEIQKIYDTGFDFYFCKTTKLLTFMDFLDSYRFGKLE